MNLLKAFTDNMNNPQGIGILDNILGIVDTGNHRISLFDINDGTYTFKTHIGSINPDPNLAGFLFPSSMIFLDALNFFVADTQNKRIAKYSYDGTSWIYSNSYLLNQSGDRFGYIVDVVKQNGHTILFLDSENATIYQLDTDTDSIVKYLQDPNWRDARAFCLGGGYLWVADASSHKVFRYDSGLNSTVFGAYGLEREHFRSPQGIEFDEINNKVYISNRDGGKISSFDIEGNFLDTYLLSSKIIQELHKARIDSNGTLYVANAATNSILIFHTSISGQFPQLLQTELNFGVVGTGYRLLLRVKMRNGGDQQFQITDLQILGTGFLVDNLTPPLPAILNPGDEIGIWINFTPTSIGLYRSVLKIISDSTNNQELILELNGEGIATEPVCIALVMDRSGSMNQRSGELTKIEIQENAARLLIDMMSDQLNNELGIISFASSATTNLNVAVLPGDSSHFNHIFNTITASGSTSIGAGLQEAISALQLTSIENKCIIVLTDGMENRSPLINDVLQSIEQEKIFTIGIGPPEYIDVSKLQQLAGDFMGYFQITDNNYHLLPKFLISVFNDSIGRQTILDPVVEATNNQFVFIPFLLSEGEKAVYVMINWEAKYWNAHIELIDPNGLVYGEEQFDWIKKNSFYAVIKKTTPRSVDQSGKWKVAIKMRWEGKGRKVNQEVKVNIMVDIYSDSDFQLKWEVKRKNKIEGKLPETEKLSFGKNFFPQTPIIHRICGSLYKGTVEVCAKINNPGQNLQFESGIAFLEKPTYDVKKRQKTIDPGKLDEPDFSFPNRTSVKSTRIISIMDFLLFLFLGLLIAVLNLLGLSIQYVVLIIGALTIVYYLLRRKWKKRYREKKTFLIADDKRSAVVELPLNDKNGAYVAITKIVAVTPYGSKIQRERRFYFYVQD